MNTTLLTAMQAARQSTYTPSPAPGMMRIYDIDQLKAVYILPPNFNGEPSPLIYHDFGHLGFCAITGCPQAKQVNGSQLCAYHAKELLAGRLQGAVGR